MSSNFSLEGSENLKRILQKYPELGYRKPIISSFSKAAKPVKKAMSDAVPSNLEAVKRVIKIKASGTTLLVGVFARQGVYVNRRGKKWDPYQIAYWHNYGTLDWRANKFNSFKTPVRRKVRSDTMAGIRPRLFIERGWEASKGQAQKIFEENFEKDVMNFLEKEALK